MNPITKINRPQQEINRKETWRGRIRDGGDGERRLQKGETVAEEKEGVLEAKLTARLSEERADPFLICL